MDNFVYHYTSLDALRSILEKEVCLWATHYSYMNDPSEQIWAEKYVIESIKRIKDYQGDSTQDIVDWFRKETYILSLCKKGDDRNMWRLYCNDGKGACLVLDRNILIDSCRQKMERNYNDCFCIVEDVEYSSITNIDTTIEKCLEKSSFNLYDEEDASKWMRVVPYIKNVDFEIEAEVRCAIIREFDHIEYLYDKEIDGMRKGKVYKNNKDIRYRMRGNDLIPYIEVSLPANALKGIILGYEVEEAKANDYISNVIKYSNGDYKDLKIRKSNLFSSHNQIEYNEDISL